MVPGSLADVSPQWLTSTLASAGLLSAGAVTGVEAQVVGADRGFTGVVGRLRLAYRDAAGGLPTSLIVKLPTAEQETASAYRRAQQDEGALRRHFDRCAREVAFYRELASGPAMPACYYAEADPERLRVVLLLEDVVDGRPGDKLLGCTPAQAGAVLAALLPLHAQWWGRTPLAWVPPFVLDPLTNQQRYAERLEPFLHRYGHQLPGPVRSLLRRLREQFADTLTELANAPQSIIHGEPHLDNVMFLDRDRDRPAVLLDWQSVRSGPVALDVAEVLTGGLDATGRRRAGDALLASYAAALARSGIRYSIEQLRHDCRLALLCQVAGLVGWLAVADLDEASARERALFEAAFGDGRLIAALQDHGLA